MERILQSITVRYSMRRSSTFVLAGLGLSGFGLFGLIKLSEHWQALLLHEYIVSFLEMALLTIMLLGGLFMLRSGVLALRHQQSVVTIDQHGIRVYQPAMWQRSQREWQLSWQNIVMVTAPSTYCFAFHSPYHHQPMLLATHLLKNGTDSVFPTIKQYITASRQPFPPENTPTTTFPYSWTRGLIYWLWALFCLGSAYVSAYGLVKAWLNHSFPSGWWKFLLGLLLFGSIGLWQLSLGLVTLFYRRPVLTLDGKGITVRNPATLRSRNRNRHIAWQDINYLSLRNYNGRGIILPLHMLTVTCHQYRQQHQKLQVLAHPLKGGADAVFYTVSLYHAAHTESAESWTEFLHKWHGLSPSEREEQIEQIEQTFLNLVKRKRKQLK